jgi:hypothetical protein
VLLLREEPEKRSGTKRDFATTDYISDGASNNEIQLQFNMAVTFQKRGIPRRLH